MKAFNAEAQRTQRIAEKNLKPSFFLPLTCFRCVLYASAFTDFVFVADEIRNHSAS
jgi:hypothetical protein